MWVAIAAITGWALITLYRIHIAGRTREHLHRERLAMIERGLVPPPEADPQTFERIMGAMRRPDRGAHSLRVGLLVVATGIGLAIMGYLGTIRDSGGVGTGAFLVLIGIAFLVNSIFEARAKRSDQQPPQEKGGSGGGS